jgi:hypothetical protein
MVVTMKTIWMTLGEDHGQGSPQCREGPLDPGARSVGGDVLGVWRKTVQLGGCIGVDFCPSRRPGKDEGFFLLPRAEAMVRLGWLGGGLGGALGWAVGEG